MVCFCLYSSFSLLLTLSVGHVEEISRTSTGSTVRASNCSEATKFFELWLRWAQFIQWGSTTTLRSGVSKLQCKAVLPASVELFFQQLVALVGAVLLLLCHFANSVSLLSLLTSFFASGCLIITFRHQDMTIVWTITTASQVNRLTLMMATVIMKKKTLTTNIKTKTIPMLFQLETLLTRSPLMVCLPQSRLLRLFVRIEPVFMIHYRR